MSGIPTGMDRGATAPGAADITSDRDSSSGVTTTLEAPEETQHFSSESEDGGESFPGQQPQPATPAEESRAESLPTARSQLSRTSKTATSACTVQSLRAKADKDNLRARRGEMLPYMLAGGHTMAGVRVLNTTEMAISIQYRNVIIHSLTLKCIATAYQSVYALY